MKKLLLLAVICSFMPGLVLAAEDHAAVKKTLGLVMPGETNYKITNLPGTGIVEVDFGDGFIYLTEDGKYALKGDIIDLYKNVNITEAKRSKSRLDTLATIDEANMLIYPADKERKHSITVFTDIDCGYCRRMHQGIKEYTSRGIEVRYVFYPRAGRNSPSYNKAVSVWCADDSQMAMNMIVSGQAIESAACENPIDKHMSVANVLGVTGTPTIFLEDGRRLPGYVKAPKLEYILNNQPVASR